MRRVLAIALVFALAAACASVPTRDPVSIGMTAEEVRERLGPPVEVSATQNGQIWEYQFDVREGGSYSRESAKLHFNSYGELSKVGGLPGRYIKPSAGN